VKEKEAGFTLIELIIVVLIVAVLAGIAIPNYVKSKGRVIEKEGIANVKLIAGAETISNSENGAYTACVCSNATDCVAATGCAQLLKIMLNSTNWNYSVDGSGNITASAQGASGLGGCTYTLAPASYTNEPVAAACP